MAILIRCVYIGKTTKLIQTGVDVIFIVINTEQSDLIDDPVRYCASGTLLAG